jgi:transposase
MGWYDRKVRRVRDLSCGDTRIFLELEVRRVDCRCCGSVKRERLDFLADNPLYTKRFAHFVGRRCRGATIKEVAEELALDWHTVKALDMQYMQAQLKRAGTPGPQVIGVDEISIRKGHSYRIVVSDLVRGRPIWFGGEDRSEASMSRFYAWLGKRKSSRIRLAVMDMWKPFSASAAAAVLGIGAAATLGDTQTRFGWTAGAGIEYAVTNNISAKVEYLYVDLGSQNQILLDNVKFPPAWCVAA